MALARAAFTVLPLMGDLGFCFLRAGLWVGVRRGAPAGVPPFIIEHSTVAVVAILAILYTYRRKLLKLVWVTK